MPDFLINAGGVISVYHEQIQDLSKEKVFAMTENIYSKVEDVLKLSSKNNISTNVSAIIEDPDFRGVWKVMYEGDFLGFQIIWKDYFSLHCVQSCS